jgi:hypothetical protein
MGLLMHLAALHTETNSYMGQIVGEWVVVVSWLLVS